MAVRDVRFDILADDKTRAAFNSVRRNLGDTRRQTAGLVADLKRSVAGFGSAGRSIVAGFGIAGALTQLRRAVREFDEIADSAAASGLSTDFYQAMTAGALEAGSSQEKMNDALLTFARNAGLAAEGKGRMVAQLKALNPELLTAIQSTSNQEARLRLLADALNNEENASTRAALAAATLGGNWAELIEVFQGGSAAIDQLVARAENMGLIIPRDLLERGSELESQLNVLSRVISVQLNSSLVELAPLIQAIITGFGYMASAARLAYDAINSVTGAQMDQTWAEKVHATIAEIENLKTSIAQAEAQNIVPGHWYQELARLQAQLEELKKNRPSEVLRAGGGGEEGEERGGSPLNLPSLRAPLNLLPRVTEETNRLVEAQNRLAESLRAVGEQAGDALGRIIFDGAKAKDVIIQLLIQMARAQLTKNMGGLFEIIGGLFRAPSPALAPAALPPIRSALAGGGANGGRIVIELRGSEDFDARVANISGSVAVAAVERSNMTLPQRIREASRDRQLG